MTVKHLICAEDHGMVAATMFGLENTDQTLRAALAALGSHRAILVLSPRYTQFPESLPGEQIWVISSNLVSPPSIT